MRVRMSKLQRQMSWVRTVAENLQHYVEKIKKELDELDVLVKKSEKRRKKARK